METPDRPQTKRPIQFQDGSRQARTNYGAGCPVIFAEGWFAVGVADEALIGIGAPESGRTRGPQYGYPMTELFRVGKARSASTAIVVLTLVCSRELGCHEANRCWPRLAGGIGEAGA